MAQIIFKCIATVEILEEHTAPVTLAALLPRDQVAKMQPVVVAKESGSFSGVGKTRDAALQEALERANDYFNRICAKPLKPESEPS